jgi:hypothetical protein
VIPWLASFGRAACLAAAVSSPQAASAPHRPTRVHLGMWSTHLNAKKPALDNNWLVAVTHRGFFAGTFVNSFNKRAFTAGIERPLARGVKGPLEAELGFRLGAISGYDERFLKIAKHTPVLPIVQVFSLFSYNGAGVEITYTMVVASVSFAFRF